MLNLAEMVVRTLLLAGLVAFGTQAIGETLSRLEVGDEVYTNVTVISVTATDIYFRHNGGLGNAKLSELEPGLQERFHFDPAKASAQETRQHRNHAAFVQALMTAPQPEKRVEDTPPDLVITVEAVAPAVSYEYYDMSRPKPPEISPGSDANTIWSFGCAPEITWDPTPRRADSGFYWRMSEVKVLLKLPIKITLPGGASARVRAHEEGHRKISEHYYAVGAEAAQHLGELIKIREFYSPDGEIEKAKAAMTARATMMVRYSYWNYALEPCKEANKYYDEITSHGTNRIDSNEAVAQAIARFEPQLSKQPTWSGGMPASASSAD